MAGRVIVVGVTVPISLALFGQRLSLMADRGWQVHVVVGEPVDVPDPRITLHVIPMIRAVAPAADIASLRAWTRLLRRLRPAIVIGATPKAALLAMTSAWIVGVPERIFEVWGARWDRQPGTWSALLRAADRVAARAATRSVAVSASLADLLVAERVTLEPALVLGRGGTQGVDLQRFQPAQRSPDRPATIGCLGRLSADKGLWVLPEVMLLVGQNIEGVQVRIAGGPDEADPLDPVTEAWLHGDPAVQLLGPTADVPGFLHDIDVLCFPSRREGLPNAVIEAAASGVPTVAWDVTGTRDAIVDGVTGYLVPYGDNAALAARITSLLRNVPHRQRMGAAARAFVGEEYAADEVQRRYIDLLDDMSQRQ